MDETLSAPPFLSLTVSGEAPMLFALEPLNATRWTGRITLPAGLTGMAQPVFAAYDGAGNVGADIVDHAPCFIDTAGPALTDILTSPAALIYNPGHAQIRVTFVLDEAPAAMPRFRYRLN